MTPHAGHDSYIAAAPEQFRPALQRLREVLTQALPDAEEMTAYNMPGFSVQGRVVASYAAFSKQLGLYVLGPAIAEHAEELRAAGLKPSKTGVTFPAHKMPADQLVERLVRTSREHLDG